MQSIINEFELSGCDGLGTLVTATVIVYSFPPWLLVHRIQASSFVIQSTPLTPATKTGIHILGLFSP
jgi:hypothetical protein